MRRLGMILLLAFPLLLANCSRESQEAPAPDMASDSAPAGAEHVSMEQVAAAGDKAVQRSQNQQREPDYKHLAQIRNAGEGSVGKVARMYLKLNRHYEYKPRWVVMLATDGSYASTMLHYDEGFEPLVKNMKPGFVYDVEFEVLRVTSGGQPWGEMLSIDQKSNEPVQDQTQFLPAVEAIHQAKQLPENVKEARRELLREKLTEFVDEADQRTELIKEAKEVEAERRTSSDQPPEESSATSGDTP